MKQRIRKFWNDERGYNMTEILVVLVIIGILIMIAIPIYRNITTRAKTTEARVQLGHVETLQKAYYLEYDRYSEDLEAIGFEQSLLVSEGGRARYVIEIEEAGPNGFVATATSIVDFDKDGVFNVWEVTEAGIIEQRVGD